MKTAIIKFTSDQVAPRNGLYVGFSIVQAGNFVALNKVGNKSIRIPFGETSFDLEYEIAENSVYEPDGSITLTLGTKTSFRFGPNRALTVNIADNDAPPTLEVSTSGDSTLVTEGAPVSITITSNQNAPGNGLLVNYQATQSGNFFAIFDTGQNSKRIYVGRTSTTLEFMTEDDEIDESNGSITVSLLSGAGYSLGTNKLVTVEILDNDGPTSFTS